MMTDRSSRSHLEAAIRPGRARRLRIAIDLEFDARIPLPDGYIVTAIADGLLELDRQGLLFPGVDWPRHQERLRDWSVRLTGSGGRAEPFSPMDEAVERRRREGDLGPGAAPLGEAAERLRQEANQVLAAIDDLEPEVMERARAAWSTIVRLRQAAALLGMPDTSPVELRAAIKEAKDLISRAR